MKFEKECDKPEDFYYEDQHGFWKKKTAYIGSYWMLTTSFSKSMHGFKKDIF